MDNKKTSISVDVIFYIIFGATLIGIGIGTYLHHYMLDIIAPLAMGVMATVLIYSMRFYETNRKLLTEKRILSQNLDYQKAKTSRYKSFAEAMVQGQEQEKKRLALELHDDTIQRLIIIGQTVQLLKLDANSAQLLPDLNRVGDLVNDSIDSIRMFIKELRPTYLEKLGLIPSLRELIVQIKESTSTAIVINLETEGTAYRLQGDIELTIYRIAQSAISNIVRHSGANKAMVRLAFHAGQVELSIEDNGIGFYVPDDTRLLKNANFGLMGMQERADLVGAQFTVQTSPGNGTKITITIPVNNAQASAAN